MDTRIAKALAAGTVMALPLLSACGAGTTAPAGSAAPAASSAAVPTAPATSASPVDETANVQAAAGKFVKTALTLGYADDAAGYAARVEPLMTEKGYAKWKAAISVDEALKTQKKKFGERVRSTPRLVGKVKVSALSETKAEAAVTFESQIQQRTGSTWKIVKRSVDDTAKVGLVLEDGAWLVDDLP